MPLREYLCDACGHRFEVIQKMSDPPLEVCPKCGGVVHKLQAAPAFHLKGTGWYVTDYAKKDQQRSGKSDGDSKESSTGSADKDKGGDKGSDKGGDKGGDKDKSETKTESGKTTTSTDTSSKTTSPSSSTSTDKKP